MKLKGTMLGLYTVSSIALKVVFNNHNLVRFLYLIEFEKLAFCMLGEIESTVVRLIAFFTKHISQCSLKRATKSSKYLFVKPWGPSWMDFHIFSKTFSSGFVNDSCKICFLWFDYKIYSPSKHLNILTTWFTCSFIKCLESHL